MLERKKIEFLWKGGFLCLGIDSYVYLIAVLLPSCGKWKQVRSSQETRGCYVYFSVYVCVCFLLICFVFFRP